MSRVVVTGASGFIGSHTVRELRNNGYEVVEVDLKCNPPIDFTHPGFKNHIQPCDKVLHLGAVARFSDAKRNPWRAIRVNVEGTLNVIQACIESQAERLVFSSTGSVYSQHSPIPIHEDAPRKPCSVYGTTKKHAEDYIFLFGKQLPFVVLRYPYIYGEGKTHGLIGAILSKIENRESPVLFGGSQQNDFLYVDDIVRANLLALETEHVNQVYNIGSGRSRSVRKVCELILKHADSDLRPVIEPPRPVDFKIFEYDTTKAKNKLGFYPKWSLENGLKEMLRRIKDAAT